MSVRCMQCGAVHQTEPLPFCACGSVRFVSFDDERKLAGDDDEPSEGHWAEVPEPDELAPKTPRDMPEQAEGETTEVAALRPVDDKPEYICQQADCYEQATHRFTWPGHSESRACFAHAQKATRLADAMGFFLEAPAL